MEQQESDLMTVKDNARYLGVKPSGVYSMVSQKKIPHYRIGRKIRFKKSDIDAWLEKQKEEVVDIKKEAKKVLRSIGRKAKIDVDRILRKTIDEAREKGYTSDHGKSDRKSGGLRKEVEHGSL